MMFTWRRSSTNPVVDHEKMILMLPSVELLWLDARENFFNLSEEFRDSFMSNFSYDID